MGWNDALIDAAVIHRTSTRETCRRRWATSSPVLCCHLLLVVDSGHLLLRVVRRGVVIEAVLHGSPRRQGRTVGRHPSRRLPRIPGTGHLRRHARLVAAAAAR